MPVYAGKLLRIDLTHKTWREEPIADEAVRKWLLGSGLAAKIYYDEMDPALDPARPRQPADRDQRRARRHLCAHRLPQLVVRSFAADRHLERGEPGALLGRGAALRRLRRADHHRPGRVAHLPVDQRGDRRHRVPRRGSPVGPRLVRDGRRAAGGDRSEGPGRRHRHGGREPGQDRRHHVRAVELRARGRARGHGRAAGQQEPEGDRGARQGAAGIPRPQALPRRGQGAERVHQGTLAAHEQPRHRGRRAWAPRSSATCPSATGPWATGPRR